VKNTLATVISIAHQSARSRAAEEAWRAFEARIFALAHTHTHLARTHWAGVLLERILSDQLAPYRDGPSAVRLTGPAIVLNARCALSLSLAIHELTTNAAKYGALSEESGRLAVDWAVQPARNELQMSWIESGGPEVSPPLHSGFGRLLLERVLASDLDGAVSTDFAPGGLTCRITFPLGAAAMT
jgi:two-component sensor histidine kinase